MTKQEFETLAGYEVTMEDYTKILEPMYMATNLTKQEFVAVIDKNRFALRTIQQIVNEIKRDAKEIEKTCNHFYDSKRQERIRENLNELRDRTHDIWVIYTEETYCRCSYPAVLEHATSKGATIKKYQLA